jgi:hypothetical protein
MLRASGEATGTPIEYRAIVDDDVDPLLPWGAQLRDLATALTLGKDLPAARSVLVEVAGAQAAAAVVAVCANFQMMNRVLDATGCPVPAQARSSTEVLGIELDR